KDELVKLATRLIVEEALEGEAGDVLGRDYYEHGAQPGQGYRNGYRTGRLRTAEGAMEYSAPQIAGRDEPFRSAIREHLKGHTQGLEDLAIEMLARGLSVRDIEDAFKDENGRLLLSKSAVSHLGERLWEDYRAFAQRDLSEYEITYLFVDGIAERLRPGAKREPVLAAWGFTIEGPPVLLHMMTGSKEDAETGTALFEDMKRRGLNDPLLVASDGAPGIIKAIEICFPRAARQRCLAHRMHNLAAKVPEDVWPEFKVRAQAAYQAPSRAIARELAAGIVADYGRKYDSAVACFMDDFEACIAHLRFPVAHRRRCSVDWPVEDHGCHHFIVPQGSYERDRLPCSLRNVADQSLATRAAASETDHVDGDRGLIDKDQSRRIKIALLTNPAPPRSRHVGAVLLSC